MIGNARLKAQAICAATGLPAVSDDTGLFVDALGGAPGVYAARFAGEDATYADNRDKLLRELDEVDDRGASFVSLAMVVWPDGREVASRVFAGWDRIGGDGGPRVRLRPGVHSRRRRRPFVLRR